MHLGGYTIVVKGLSPTATEIDVIDFFVHCGPIEHVEISRSGEYSCVAFVKFSDFSALQTAIFLNGSEIGGRRVEISWLEVEEDVSEEVVHTSRYVQVRAGATLVGEVARTMIAKGYTLGKDAIAKAKEMDGSYQASAKLSDLSRRIGLTDHISHGVDTVRSADERYHISEITKSAAVVAGTAAVVTYRTAASITNTVVTSNAFSKAALLVSDLLSHTSKAIAQFASPPSNHP